MAAQQEKLPCESCNCSVCTWWLAYLFDNRLRKFIHNPGKVVGPYVERGMHVLDLGCGMGFFSLAMAEMVGEDGGVTAVDLQRKMLDVLLKRAEKRNLAARIHLHETSSTALNLALQADFALACWMVHEVPDTFAFFEDVYSQMKAGAHFLVLEPRGHCSVKMFAKEEAAACAAGFVITENPKVSLSHAMLLTK